MPRIDPEPRELRVAAESMADYLARATMHDGRFVYLRNADPQAVVPGGYNEVRHAGAIYAMADAYARSPTPSLLAAIVRATDYLKRVIIGPVEPGSGMLCAWSRPELTHKPGAAEAKLGGTGLALVALVGLERIAPRTTTADDLRALGQFLVWMQKKNGLFYSKYRPSEDGRSDAFVSRYYPGEAALGLAMLGEFDRDARWLGVAARGLAAIALRRAGQLQVDTDHWALLATARLFWAAERTGPPIPGDLRQLLMDHVRQIVVSMLDGGEQHPADSALHGSFTPDGRTTPTATRLEGLTAVVPYLDNPADADLAARAVEAIAAGASFLLRARLVDGELDGGIPRAIVAAPGSPPSSVGEADFKATEVRIDFVQHALSAVLGWERVIANLAAGRGSVMGDLPASPDDPHTRVEGEGV